MNDKERAQMERKLDRLKARLADNTEEVDRLLKLVKEAGNVKEINYNKFGPIDQDRFHLGYVVDNQGKRQNTYLYTPCFKDCGCTWSYTESDMPSGVEYEPEGVCEP